jgi:hypothetical protein
LKKKRAKDFIRLATPVGRGGPGSPTPKARSAGVKFFASFCSQKEGLRAHPGSMRLGHSRSLANLRQRLSQAMVRSTIQRLGKTVKPLA